MFSTLNALHRRLLLSTEDRLTSLIFAHSLQRSLADLVSIKRIVITGNFYSFAGRGHIMVNSMILVFNFLCVPTPPGVLIRGAVPPFYAALGCAAGNMRRLGHFPEYELDNLYYLFVSALDALGNSLLNIMLLDSRLIGNTIPLNVIWRTRKDSHCLLSFFTGRSRDMEAFLGVLAASPLFSSLMASSSGSDSGSDGNSDSED